MTPTPTMLVETWCDCAVGVTCDAACLPVAVVLPAPVLGLLGVLVLIVALAWVGVRGL